jgi:dipeptidyl aminopeptidase/acylaminoacyl peptidase
MVLIGTALLSSCARGHLPTASPPTLVTQPPPPVHVAPTTPVVSVPVVRDTIPASAHGPSEIAYLCEESLCLIGGDGSHPHPAGSISMTMVEALSPDFRQTVWVSSSPPAVGDSYGEVEVSTVGQPGFRSLWRYVGLSAGWVAWSPDGSRLAVTIRPTYISGSHDTPSGLWIVNADGSGARRVAGGDNLGPVAWDPSGTKVVFAAPNEPYPPPDFLPTESIKLVAATGGAISVVPAYISATVSSLSWSPDGQTILVTHEALIGQGSVEAVPLDGGATKLVLATSPGESFSSAIYSPDGSKIAVMLSCPLPYPPGVSPSAYGEIDIADADGTHPSSLMTPTADPCTAPPVAARVDSEQLPQAIRPSAILGWRPADLAEPPRPPAAAVP